VYRASPFSIGLLNNIDVILGLGDPFDTSAAPKEFHARKHIIIGSLRTGIRVNIIRNVCILLTVPEVAEGGKYWNDNNHCDSNNNLNDCILTEA
jgi:hypothetical protein